MCTAHALEQIRNDRLGCFYYKSKKYDVNLDIRSHCSLLSQSVVRDLNNLSRHVAVQDWCIADDAFFVLLHM